MLRQTIYYIILCCFCAFSYGDVPKNKILKPDLNISLLIYHSGGNPATLETILTEKERINYSIDIINDNLTIRYRGQIYGVDESRRNNVDYEYRVKLTNNQYSEIARITSVFTQKYIHHNKGSAGFDNIWGCILKVGNQIYYSDHMFFFNREKQEGRSWKPTPKEIILLINYIVDLSPIPIVLSHAVPSASLPNPSVNRAVPIKYSFIDDDGAVKNFLTTITNGKGKSVPFPLKLKASFDFGIEISNSPTVKKSNTEADTYYLITKSLCVLLKHQEANLNKGDYLITAYLRTSKDSAFAPSEDTPSWCLQGKTK